MPALRGEIGRTRVPSLSYVCPPALWRRAHRLLLQLFIERLVTMGHVYFPKKKTIGHVEIPIVFLYYKSRNNTKVDHPYTRRWFCSAGLKMVEYENSYFWNYFHSKSLTYSTTTLLCIYGAPPPSYLMCYLGNVYVNLKNVNTNWSRREDATQKRGSHMKSWLANIINRER